MRGSFPKSAALAMAGLLAAPWLVPAARADDESPDEAPREAAPSESADDEGVRSQPVSPDGPTRHKAPPASSDDIIRNIPRKAAAPADAAATEGGRRIQLFLIPVGGDTDTVVGPAQLGIESEVNRMPGYHPVDLAQELAAAIPPALAAKVAEARHSIEDGAIQFADHQFVESSNRYSHALELLINAGSGTSGVELTETYVRQAVSLQFAGEDERARDAFRSAARIDLAKQFDARKVDVDLAAEFLAARRDITRGGQGGLTISTTPPGARVFVGGVFRGTTGPSGLAVEHLPVGQNYVRIDRPGADAFAQLVEVKLNQDVPIRLKMNFSQETADLQSQLQQLPTALDSEKGVPDMVRALAKRFRLERVITATVRMAREDRVGVRIAVFDMRKDVRLADERGIFVMDVETLRDEVAKWARGVFDRADGSRNRAATDPLNRSDGTEDWYANKYEGKAKPASDDTQTADTSGTQPSQPTQSAVEAAPAEPAPTDPPPQKNKGKKKRSGRDPLDNVDGTDDW